MSVIINGISYNVSLISLKRSFEVADGDSSGRTADWNMHRDVIGTFYNYSCEVSVANFDFDSYNKFYEVITAPKESHSVTFPYGNSSITFRAYVTKGTDSVQMINNGKTLWNKLTFNFIAMQPQRKA